MHLENYHQNQNLIKQGKAFTWSYFLIESDGSFQSFKTEYFELFSLNDMELTVFDVDESNPNLVSHGFYPMNQNIFKKLNNAELKRKINAYKEISNIYLLRLKIASMEGNPLDQNTITVANPPGICEHILSLFGLVHRFFYFKIINISLSIRFDDKRLPSINVVEDRIEKYDNIMLSLREDQYLLVMNSLRFFNLSKIMSHTDTIYAYSMLCSCIETFSQLYVVEKDFHTHEVGKSLKKEMENANIETSKIDRVMDTYGKKYEKSFMYQTTKNFQNWCNQMLDAVLIKNIQLIQTQETKNMFNLMISNWYALRSTVMHGSIIESNSTKRNTPIIFNERNKRGNIKSIQSKVNTNIEIQKITTLLPYNAMLGIVMTIIYQSILFLSSKKEDIDEVDIYKRISFFELNKPLRMTTKVDTVKPLHFIRVGIDTYNPYTIEHQYNNLLVFDSIIEKIQQKQFTEAIKLFHNLVNLGEMEDDELYEKLRAYLDKCCKELHDYKPMLDFLEQSEININSYRYSLLNDMAFCLSKLGQHENAHEIIDQVIEKEIANNHDNQKLGLFYDTKGDIYHNQTNNQKALELWEKSLECGESIYSKQTKEKINLISQLKL